MSVSTRALVLGAIRGYQAVVSPLLGARCRFEPSCSAFAYEAVERHGTAAGSWLAVKRLARCRPGGGGGYDPVPPVDRSTFQSSDGVSGGARRRAR